MSYRFVDSFRAGPGWNSCHDEFVKSMHLVGFIIKKFVIVSVYCHRISDYSSDVLAPRAAARLAPP